MVCGALPGPATLMWLWSIAGQPRRFRTAGRVWLVWVGARHESADRAALPRGHDRGIPAPRAAQDQLRFGSRSRCRSTSLRRRTGFLGNLYREAGPTMRTRAAQLATLQQAFDGQGSGFGPDDDLDADAGDHRYLVTDAVRAGCFRVDVSDKPLPYVVTRLDYIASSNDETGKVLIELKANAKGTLRRPRLPHCRPISSARRWQEIFAAKGFLRGDAGTDRRLRRSERALFRLARPLRRAVFRQGHRLSRRRPERHASRHGLVAQGRRRAVDERRRGAPGQ